MGARVERARARVQKRHPGDWFIRFNEGFGGRVRREAVQASLEKQKRVIEDPREYRRFLVGKVGLELTDEEIEAVVETMWALWPGRIK